MTSFNLGPVAKAVNGTVLAVLGTLIAVLPDGITLQEVLLLLGQLVASSQAIFWVANGGRFGPYAKAISTAVTAALGIVGAGLLAGQALSPELVIAGVIALLNSFVVVPQTPNSADSDYRVVHDATGVDEGEPDVVDEEEPAEPVSELAVEDSPSEDADLDEDLVEG